MEEFSQTNTLRMLDCYTDCLPHILIEREENTFFFLVLYFYMAILLKH